MSHVLVLALWIGAVALVLGLSDKLPAILGSRDLSATMLSAILAQLGRFGLLAGPIALVTLWMGWSSQQVPLKGRGFLSLAFMVGGITGAQWLWPRLEDARLALGRPLEDLPSDDTLAVAYGSLQLVSIGWLAAMGFFSLVLILWAVRGSKPAYRGGIQI